LNPGKKPRVAYVSQCFAGGDDGLVVAASDYLKSLPYSLRSWIGGDFVGLGTEGFGRSERRSSLRDYFEVDARHVAWAVLESRTRNGAIKRDVLDKAAADLGIDPSKPNPLAF
jgi:pyruvate dehydrogenase E1 component